MRRQTSQDVAEAARARLALLEEQLAAAGELTRARPALDPGDELSQRDPHDLGQVFEEAPRHEGGTVPRARVVAAPGRHSRRRAPGPGDRAAGWVADRLPPGLRGRVGLDAGHLVVLSVLLVIGLLVGGMAYLHRGSSQTVPLARSRPETGGPGALVSAAPAAPGAGAAVTTPVGAAPAGATPGSATGGEVIVDVAGKVRHPGIVRLPAGSRVADALEEAGGVRAGVNLTALNLARVLTDGEQILVGIKPPPGSSVAAAGGSATTPAPSSTSSDGPLVNINTASESELETLPGVGPVTAQKILDWRETNQTFSSVDELLEIDGIGEKTLAEIAPHVTL